MLIYHGTSEAVARAALEDGLLPREEAEVESNWEEHPSRADMVYLTRAYAPYFALCAAEPGEKWGMVEIDTSLIVPDGFDDPTLEEFLFPDEDFLEQISRSGNSDCPEGLDLTARTTWFREHLLGFQHYWKNSVEGLGNCACHGPIPAECVTKVVIFEPSSNPYMAMMASDPMISLMNYRLLGGSKYRALTDWFFGYEVLPEHFEPTYALLRGGQDLGNLAGHLEKAFAALEEAMIQREGIEVIS
jgi:hypothetical protein